MNEIPILHDGVYLDLWSHRKRHFVHSKVLAVFLIPQSSSLVFSRYYLSIVVETEHFQNSLSIVLEHKGRDEWNKG